MTTYVALTSRWLTPGYGPEAQDRCRAGTTTTTTTTMHIAATVAAATLPACMLLLLLLAKALRGKQAPAGICLQ